MESVDVPVALLGYGTVGAAVNRLLTESADDIERATGHRLRVVKALVQDLGKERVYPPAGGVLTTDFREIADDPTIAVVAEVMGGVEPAGGYVLELLRGGKHVVSANKQLIARRGAELFEAASSANVQLRFEASVCAAIPVIKVLRESLVDKQHPLAKVDGAFNAVMLQGDAIREITLEGPGAGGIETASAVIADITTVIGTMHTGFLQNDAAWRTLPKLPAGDNRSPFYFRLSVEDRPGALAHVAEELADREISIARLLQHQNGDGAALHVVTHQARAGALEDALAALGDLSDVHKRSQ